MLSSRSEEESGLTAVDCVGLITPSFPRARAPSPPRRPTEKKTFVCWHGTESKQTMDRKSFSQAPSARETVYLAVAAVCNDCLHRPVTSTTVCNQPQLFIGELCTPEYSVNSSLVLSVDAVNSQFVKFLDCNVPVKRTGSPQDESQIQFFFLSGKISYPITSKKLEGSFGRKTINSKHNQVKPTTATTNKQKQRKRQQEAHFNSYISPGDNRQKYHIFQARTPQTVY